MGRGAAADIARQLVASGLDPATPVLIASDVSLPSECLVHTRLDLLGLAIGRATGAGPALILVGQALRAPRELTLVRVAREAAAAAL